MKNYIKKINEKYYCFRIDSYGNLYDTMRHFKTLNEAIKYMKLED